MIVTALLIIFWVHGGRLRPDLIEVRPRAGTPRAPARAHAWIAHARPRAPIAPPCAPPMGLDALQTLGIALDLPDLRGRSIIHYGAGPGLSAVTMGQVSGAESVTLTIQNMPAHNHQLLFDTGAIASSAVESVERGLSDSVDVPALSQPGANTSNSTTVTGSNAPVSIRSPYLAMNTCIATQGIWPSRP